ncbi:MAG: hypothetical protein OHK0015_07070 [Chloroflexi bacterium OHK40]
MSQHTPFFELQAAFGGPGCAICALTVRTLERYFAGLVYEKVNDIRTRESIRRAYGFCAAHGAMLRSARSALGVAIVQRDVLRAAAAALAAAPPSAAPQGWRAALPGARRQSGAPLDPRHPCPACELAAATAAGWVQTLVRDYSGLRPALQASSGLCLDHLRAALAHSELATAAELREDQLAIWARLEAELDELIRKHDHQFAAEPVGAERDAWARATELLAGDWRVTGSSRG